MQARKRRSEVPPGVSTLKAVPRVESASVPPLVAALVEAVDEQGATLRIGKMAVRARLDGSVDEVVIRGAHERGERVIAQEEAGEWVILGALRSKASAGIDPLGDAVIRADRLRIDAENEVQIVSGASSLVLRAAGHVETIAKHITARASAVHKLIGRMLHLN